ncbi:MAG: hypothetical protein ABMA13_20195 [Chthoniobacteraceae bacterium]
MARRVNPRGIARPVSQRSTVRSVQHKALAASASVKARSARHAMMSFANCAVLAAREPDLSGVVVVWDVMRFTPIFCQPCPAVIHREPAPNLARATSPSAALARKLSPRHSSVFHGKFDFWRLVEIP